jgi:electron transfer flavoprotein alpha subunit
VSEKALFVVVEPLGGGGGSDDAALAQAQIALGAEALRLGDRLGAQTRFVTWPTGSDVDLDLLAAAVAGIARADDPAAVLVQDGDAGRQLAPLVARRLGTCAVLGCSDARVVGDVPGSAGCEDDTTGAGDLRPGALSFIKPVYGGWLEQEIAVRPGFVPVATLDLAGLEPAEAEAEAAAAALAGAEACAIALGSPSRVRHLSTVPPDPRSVDLVHAKRIVAAGMGTADKELLAAVHELAELLEGSVGATRPMVDDGHLPKERLIGQTGRTVAPDLYVALGISGSPHHVAGVRKADRVLSVNRDARAPIFQFSDVGYVADLEAVLPLLITKIKEWREASASDAAGPAARGADGR